MEEAKKSNEKLTYEQLEQLVMNLEQQVSELKKRLFDANNHIMDLNWNNMFKRLDYLFRIVENKELANKGVWVKALNSVEEIMFSEKEESEAKEEEPKNE